jgi:hypothetical protein
MAAHLRVVPVPKDAPERSDAAPRVRLRLADLLPLVALAHRNNYVWLQDFLDDEVTVTEDLYEVLQAFRCYRPSA